MKRINQVATKVLCTLLDKTNSEYQKFESDGFMPLILSHVSPLHHSNGEFIGNLYTLAHTYLQNGDIMHDPAMDFMVIGYAMGCDPRTVFIYPVSFRQDATGHYIESVKFEGAHLVSYLPRLQADHTYFANQWLLNIKQQGFLK